MKLNPRSPSNRLFGYPPGTYSIKTWNDRNGERQNHVVFTTFQEVREYLESLGLTVGTLRATLDYVGEALLENRNGWTASVVYCRPGR